ncbi:MULTISPECIES: hypothetical protein [Vreelandella]|uniref:Uncharacterized protein n=2 Tax=Vreelandella TaxID=3137766 RepID=A0A7C9NP66_9GAMM|nr:MULTISPECIES: hypothetical protein [Halomonas]NDL71709.1 hypothetical protein [Halomonas alkaliphila]NYS46475.1 hypothetical protein [Halomonas zhaodongensis]
MDAMLKRLHLTHPLHFVVGLTLWCIWFIAVYGGHAVACEAFAPAPEQGVFTLLNGGLLIVSIVTTGLLLLLTWGCYVVAKQHQGRDRFNAVVSAGLYLFSAFSVVFVALPIIGVPPCL